MDTAAGSTIFLSPDYRVRPLDHLQWVLERGDINLKPGRLQPVAERGERWRPVATAGPKRA
jgi:hypothetical protein